MPARVAAFDWAATPLGPRESWPTSLRTVVDLVLSSALSTSVLWGDDLIQIYNDAYARVLGPRHPAALGRPVLEVWPETRAATLPLYTGVRRGETFWFENQRYDLERGGFVEETYFTYGYSPIRDDDAEVVGVLVTGVETTAQVLGARRAEVRLDSSTRLAGAQTVADVVRLVRAADPVPDIPFAELHLTGDAAFPEALQEVARARELRRLDWPGGGAPRPALALPVDGLEQEAASGVLVLGLNPQVELDEAYQGFLIGYARQVGAALVRVRSQEQAELNRKLEEERAALDAFAAFTEAVGSETEISALARRAVEVLLARYPGGTVVYYEPEGDRWRARVWSDDLRPELLRLLQKGLPGDTPFIAGVLREQQGVFTDQWNPEQQRVEHTGEYGMSAHLPIRLGGEVRGLLGLASRERQQWSGRDRALLGAVARGLALALERAEQTRQLDEERAALDAFAAFTEEVGTELDVLTLIGRAITLLGDRYGVEAMYFDREGDLFRARVWSPDFPPELLARSRQGFTLDYPDVARAARERQTVFVDGWETPAHGVEESAIYGAVAMQPFFEGDEVVGVLAAGLRGRTRWTGREQGVLRAVGRSLTLALERAARLGQIERQRERLADLNAELGGFITRTAHNLEEPARRLGHLLGPGRPGNPQALEGLPPYDPDALRDEVTRLRSVARDLRQLSSMEGQDLNRDLLPLGELFAEVRAGVSGTPRGEGVCWLTGPLPIVRGDRALLRQALEVLMTFTLSETRGARYVTVGSWEVEGEVQVTVEDDGTGLTGEEAATLFDLAVRTDQAVPVFPGGGLVQVRRVMARHGGWAWAEAQRSSGKVVLAFPRDAPVNELEALLRQEKPGT